MPDLPVLGSRVSLRYRLPAGSAKPLTDVIGHLERLEPTVLIRTKDGELVDIAPADVVTVRELSHTPVRASEIRALEHAAALAWPGVEQQWSGGWLLRAGHGITSRANSAIPLDVSAQIAHLALVRDWYRERDLPAWLALPERLLPIRTPGIKPARVMVREPAAAPTTPTATLAQQPDAQWLAIYERDVPVDVLTAVIDGRLTFATVSGCAVGRGAVTTAPDGTPWLGISSVRVSPAHRGQGHARAVCEALLAWGAESGARRAYVQVEVDNHAAIALYTTLGFRLHHQTRYVAVEDVLTPR
ncbi:N-acetylglutamate synthase, CG3035 family [Mycolicibacterium fortuitum]|uniref:Acetyltransferase, gnat family protein n=1 Tax=Mycolicibacterium fortuitum subsp. fortuitum DSM 46621 = ATCC 6841 = JCM 6387 TaxID=1214102 RepID=K0V2C7_MYCFO|nr:GNAT family N-acetyltransferase [Mycolicibacterium fortuitum]AIY44951.1 Histone acetyltransferase HPA2 and related acetyltransferase [Mycobacterium sp. VKM Ac-1817D]CRL81828.1 acetyltransferase, gnat family protein [Mycolicibacter nonchromogenicus]AMD53937.1 GCN5 family acetyltransferase [Mycolicibacterium fortuitum subsp. fortuitum DSM 46621 = ATCC 6841 = JCM 6387]EJZ13196.1 acetyltransferase, gnat family protein [Mycolicibacterium fortuitum subsp. fortuitum DSM 46621 = ATCC 6841 = JCM 6387